MRSSTKGIGHWLAVTAVAALAVACSGANANSDYDKTVSKLMTSQKVEVDDQVEGVWNDASESAIAVVHREGDELRVLVALGDTRANIPLTSFEVTSMGNHLPGAEERQRAAEALKTWRDGNPTPADRYLFAGAGKFVPAAVNGSWSEGNRDCNTSRWGNFYLQQNLDSDKKPVLLMSIYATKEKIEGMGGQTFEFGRIIYFGKSDKPIPPSILEKLQKADNFCRKTAG